MARCREISAITPGTSDLFQQSVDTVEAWLRRELNAAAVLAYGIQQVPHVRQCGTACLLDIPRWNFHWQGFYRFKDPVPLHAGDRVLMECHWDNSAANQPEVNGQVRAPIDVHFGEGSTDEMCAGGILMTDFR